MCFWSQRQFALWSASNNHIAEKSRCSSACVDCLPSFQVRMKRAGRCEHPETMFAFNEDSIVGYWPC